MPAERQDAVDGPGAGRTRPGRTVGGRYRLESVLGRGGMGVVWAATDELLDRAVAVKEVVLPSGVDDAERQALRARTLREARAAARVRAECAVAIHDVVEDDGRPWIVMERLPGLTLQDELERRGPMPPREVAEIGVSLLSGLSDAHAAGVLHRDVKPGNVMFRPGPDGRRAVLGDFGIAHFDGDATLTSTGMVMGSPAYVAPERAQGKPATAASDLWSLGVTLWAALEGRSPFGRENALAALNAVITEEVPPAGHAGPLRPVLDGLLQKDPARRIDAVTARSLLRQALGDGPAPGDAPARPPVAARGRPPLPPPPVRRAPVADGTSVTRPMPAAPPATTPAPAVPGSASTRPPSQASAPPPSRAPASPQVATPAPPPSWAPAGDRRPPATRRRRTGVPLLLGLSAVALLVLGAVLLRPGGGEPGDAPGEAAAGSQVEPSVPAEDEGSTDEPATDEAPVDTGAPAETDPDPEAGADGGQGGEAEQQGEGAGDPGGAGEGGAAQTVPDVPPGFERYSDPSGFSVAVPAGWQARREGPRVYLTDPASAAYLLVDQTDDPAPDPVADWQQQEPSVAGRLANYERIGPIEPVEYRGWQAADWEFVFGERQGTHVLNRNVITGPDRAYALYWSVPSSQWEAMLPVHERVVESFQPAE